MMTATVMSTKELAHKAREDKANSLRGLFDKCFMPLDISDEEISPSSEDRREGTPLIPHESPTYIENAIYSVNATYSENATRSVYETLENKTCSENDTLENTTRSGNESLGNATYSGNKSPENTTCSENATLGNVTYSGRVVQLSRSLNFTALGVLAVLLDEFSSGTGILNISQLSKACGVARSTIISQLRILEDKEIITLGPPEKGGRLLKIMCSENTTYPENATLARGSSSCSFNNLTTTTTEEQVCSENTMYPENAIRSENEICSEITTLKPFTAMQPWEKMKLRSDAEALFYAALITKCDGGLLSKQTLRLFKHIDDDKGRGHALALFLLLLPKAKDNPTGYISSAIKQGAEPNADSLKKVKEMEEILECLAKTYSPEEAKQKMQAALDKNDTQTLFSLAQQQEKYKKALHLLSWNDTFEALIQKRDDFVTSLLK